MEQNPCVARCTGHQWLNRHRTCENNSPHCCATRRGSGRTLARNREDADDLVQIARTGVDAQRTVAARHAPGQLVVSNHAERLDRRDASARAAQPDFRGRGRRRACWRVHDRRADRCHRVRKAVAQLNDDQRAVVGLVLVEGLPYKEAASAGRADRHPDQPPGALRGRRCRPSGDQARSTRMNWTDGSLMAFRRRANSTTRTRADAERALARRRGFAAACGGAAGAAPARLGRVRAGARRAGAGTSWPGLLAVAPRPGVGDRGEPGRSARRTRSAVAMPGWAQWGGMAASVVLGCSDGPAAVWRPRRRRSLPWPDRAGAFIDATGQHRRHASGRAVELRRPARRLLRTFTTAAVAGLACRRWAMGRADPGRCRSHGGRRDAPGVRRAAARRARCRRARIAGDALDAERDAGSGGATRN